MLGVVPIANMSGNELKPCKACGFVPKIEHDIWITHKYKFCDARILHFCGINTIQFKSSVGFRKKNSDVSDVKQSVIDLWNTLNDI